MVNNKDNRVFMSRNYRSVVAPWKFDVLRSSASQANIKHQISAAQLSADHEFLDRNTLLLKYENEISFTSKLNSFSYQWLCARPHFDRKV